MAIQDFAKKIITAVLTSYIFSGLVIILQFTGTIDFAAMITGGKILEFGAYVLMLMSVTGIIVGILWWLAKPKPAAGA